MTVSGATLSRRSEALPGRLGDVLTPESTIPVALTAAVLIGLGDFLTGVDMVFTLLYLFPIAVGVWARGRAFGMCMAGLSTGLSLAAEVGWRITHDLPLRPFNLLWNHAGSLGIFVLCVEVLHRLHAYVEREGRDRRLAVEQLRHAERLNVIGKLAAGVAHELGTPINVIAGSAELLGADRLTPADREQIQQRILDQTARMTAIIRQLLDFGRRGGTGRSRLDLNLLVQSACTLLEPLAKKRRVSIELELSSTPVWVEANALEIGQVLSNLALNGIQAMDHGGTLRVSTLCTARRQGRVALLVVSDEGTGIRAEDVSRIFDPFFTTKDVGEGTGLGLSVTYGIVEDHDGRVSVETEWGRGSSFTVALPAVVER